MITKRIDDYTIEITKQPLTPKPVKYVYERFFIEQQIKNIQASKNAFNVLRDTEIKECEEILTEMDKLGIIVAPIEPIEEIKL